MTNREITEAVKLHMAKLGSEGGKSKSVAKVEAVVANLEKARAMRAFYRQHPELRAAMRLRLEEEQDELAEVTQPEVPEE